MSREKEKFLIIDTETCNSLDEPLVYDIGYAVCDRDGNIYCERSFVVAEVFLDLAETMKSAYYAEKIPNYWEDIKNRKRTMQSIYKIRRQIKADIKEYNIKRIGAYNMAFDSKALNTTIRYISKSFLRWFFPYGMSYFCVWHMATQTILQQKTYYKQAVKNGWESEKGNLLTNAEVTYRYISKQIDFLESHTGLEDVHIEITIFAHCIKQHKKMDWSIKRNCWMLPQKPYKAYRATLN